MLGGGVLQEPKEVEQRRGMDGGREGEERGVSPRSGDDAGARWGKRGATGALGRLSEFQLPPHYINTHWCHTLVTHVSTHIQRH